jgi:plasmid stabilization system protein ParE
MKLVWSAAAWTDVGRIYAFLAEHDLDAADQAFDRLVNAPSQLLDFPRRGSRLRQTKDLEIRELRAGSYIVQYGLKQDEILVLRFFHGREDRL